MHGVDAVFIEVIQVSCFAGDSYHLGASTSSSAVPSPQESPLLKSVSKEPSSSTSTGQLWQHLVIVLQD